MAQAKALLPLRDQLALDRTELANHRTWLASARTALALFVSGATFLQFFDSTPFQVFGLGFMALSAPVLGLGYLRFLRERKQLAALEVPQA